MCVRKEEGSEFLQESAGETEPTGMWALWEKNTASLSLPKLHKVWTITICAELHMNVDIYVLEPKIKNR